MSGVQGGGAGEVDVAIIGGGIIGLATAYRLLQQRPGLKLRLLEREAELATHQTGRNSGVAHAGLYYAPGSLKARLCAEGKAALEAFCADHAIPYRRAGKLVVAVDESELPRLTALRERGAANGVPGLEELEPSQIREVEPHAAGIRALLSPTTGIVDFRRVALALAEDVRGAGGSVRVGAEVTAIARQADGLRLRTRAGVVDAGAVVACAGLWADRVAALTGDAGRDAPRIVPFRGDYYTLRPAAAELVRGLIYPLPDPQFPFLGVHFTRRIDGEVWAGPNAVLAFARSGYRRTDLSPRDLLGTLAYPGFLRLARRYLRTGLAEMWRDVSKPAFVAALRRYLPALRGDQLLFGPAGVRAQALRRDGTLVDDFDLGGEGRVLHVRNAPSPGATAALAIGRVLAERAVSQFGL